MSGNDDKKGKVESLSFYPVMLRLDRGIREIGCDGSKGITRSSRVMTEREEYQELWQEERRCQEMTIRKGKLIIVILPSHAPA